MGIKKRKFNNEIFEILDHDPLPGFKKAFHIIVCVAAGYFIYIFSHLL
jgi:hypothetical protein